MQEVLHTITEMPKNRTEGWEMQKSFEKKKRKKFGKLTAVYEKK